MKGVSLVQNRWVVRHYDRETRQVKYDTCWKTEEEANARKQWLNEQKGLTAPQTISVPLVPVTNRVYSKVGVPDQPISRVVDGVNVDDLLKDLNGKSASILDVKDKITGDGLPEIDDDLYTMELTTDE